MKQTTKRAFVVVLQALGLCVSAVVFYCSATVYCVLDAFMPKVLGVTYVACHLGSLAIAFASGGCSFVLLFFLVEKARARWRRDSAEVAEIAQ